MLFVCTVKIAPENRDESFKRLKEHGIGEQPGVKLLGAWISLTQQERGLPFIDAEVVAGYKAFHRYYPGFQHVDI